MPLISVQEILNAQNDSDVSVPRNEAASYRSITTSAQTTVKSGAGVLVGLATNVALTSAVRLYDNTISGGTTILTIPAATAAGTYFKYGLKFSTGLTVSTGAAADNLTIMYL